MKNRIAFTFAMIGLLILGLVLYGPNPRRAAAANLRKAVPSTLDAFEDAKQPHGVPPIMPSNTGDLVGSVTFSQDCQSGIGVGVTYDGAGHLWVSCYSSNPDLLRTNATTGVVDQTYNIKNGLGALAYDATRNAIWAGPGCATDGNVWLIQLDSSKNVTGAVSRFTPSAGAANCLDDGLGFDASDDSIYYSADTSTIIGHYSASTGTLLGSFTWTGIGCYNSGLAIGGNLLFQGSDGCTHVWVVNKNTLAPAFDFSTVVPGDPNFRDEGLSCDTDTFAGIGKQVMWSKEAYSPNRAHAFEIPIGTCGVGGATPTPTPVVSATPTATATATPRPRPVTITVKTNPAGLSYSVDGVIYTIAKSFSWQAGSTHTLATTSPQTLNGNTYVWQNWSDGGAISHLIAPTMPTAYTANFLRQ